MNIEIVGKQVFVDDILATRKRLEKSSHCREIFYTDKYVIKVSFQDMAYAGDFSQTEREFSLYKEIDKQDKVFFAKPIYLSKKRYFGVYERIFPTKHYRTEEVREKLQKLCRKYKVFDVIGRNDNWVMIGKDLPKILDYGV